MEESRHKFAGTVGISRRADGSLARQWLYSRSKNTGAPAALTRCTYIPGVPWNYKSHSQGLEGPAFFAPPTALCMIEANSIMDEFRTAQEGSSKPQTAAMVACGARVPATQAHHYITYYSFVILTRSHITGVLSLSCLLY